MWKLIEKQSFIYLETLRQHLEIKLSNLAIVWASKKVINDIPYFRYYKIAIYKLISFDKFIDLISDGTIIINIVGRVSRGGAEAGRQRNKNLVFQINKDDITKLFKPIKIYNRDLL